MKCNWYRYLPKKSDFIARVVFVNDMINLILLICFFDIREAYALYKYTSTVSTSYVKQIL